MNDFLKNFNPREESHVFWLKAIGEAMAKATNGKRVNLDAVVNENPMGCTMTNMLEFAEIHFQLSMKYSTAVLNRNAFVPK